MHRVSGLHRDPAFLVCLASGLLFWVVFFVTFSPQTLPRERLWSLPFLSLTIWQPIIEELFFRGLIQGQLRRLEWGRRSFIDISLANLLTSTLFVFAHLASHSLTWSLLVFVPSLLFGLLRDRFESVYPSIVLHIFYNAGYFLLTGGLIFQLG